MMANYRRILPSSQAVQNSHDPSWTSLSRRQNTRVACYSCRRKKARCDGQRPICSSCHRRGLQACSYEETRNEAAIKALQRGYEQATRRVEMLEGLLRALLSRQDEECADIFRRVRSANGIDVLEALARLLGEADCLVSLRSSAAKASP